MTNTEIIAVIQAAEAGKTIECRLGKLLDWHPVEEPIWDFSKWEYRVKPEPMEIWVNVYKRGIGQIYTNEQDAIKHCLDYATHTAVHFREVIE